MYERELRCTSCGKAYDLTDHYSCESCGGILEVRYDYDALLRENRVDRIVPEAGESIWRYKLLLPISDEKCMVSLAEGGTPLIQAVNLSRILGADRLYLKDETRNASGAFKDRPISVAVAKALELKRTAVTAASSGNAAASLAAYAAKAQLPCNIFVPEGTPVGKVAHAVVCGARLIKVKGDYSNSYKMAEMASRQFGWMNITTTFLNPYSFEGDKTVAYEIYRQMGGHVPDWVLVPTGAGPLVFGIYKGFMEMRNLGMSTTIPRMGAIQVEGCAPIVEAFEKGGQDVKAWKDVRTVASAIGDPLRGYERDGDLVVRVLRESNGAALAVSDAAVLQGVRDLARSEGIFSEPAAAAPVAALRELLSRGTITRDQSVVCLITGHGLKDPTSALEGIDVPIIEPDVKALERLALLHEQSTRGCLRTKGDLHASA